MKRKPSSSAAAKQPAPTGRPPAPLRASYEELSVMAGLGLTLREIALVIGITEMGLYKRRKKDPKLRDALDAGRARADLNVIKGLYTRAVTGADTAAACFWLKNRRPSEWRDRREVEIGGKVKLEFAFGDERDEAEDKGKDEEQDE